MIHYDINLNIEPQKPDKLKQVWFFKNNYLFEINNRQIFQIQIVLTPKPQNPAQMKLISWTEYFHIHRVIIHDNPV